MQSLPRCEVESKRSLRVGSISSAFLRETFDRSPTRKFHRPEDGTRHLTDRKVSYFLVLDMAAFGCNNDETSFESLIRAFLLFQHASAVAHADRSFIEVESDNIFFPLR